jgi:exonuclease VII small subunit
MDKIQNSNNLLPQIVKDKWEETDFTKYNATDHHGNPITMQLCEKEIELNNHKFREVRKLSDSKHQTSIISTHPFMTLITISIRMFARWLQENYFKYMIADYSLDHIYQYGVEEIEISKQIVNPAHRSVSNQYKKEKEKLGRLEKELVKNVKLDIESSLDTFKENIESKAKLVEKIEEKRQKVTDLLAKKKDIPYKITLQDLPKDERYNTLRKESTYFMATLKMICYRAETALTNLIRQSYKKADNEKRTLIKEIIFNAADIKPDYQKNELLVTMHSMSTPMKNEIVLQLCHELNETETVFPGTNLKLVYKSMAG